jgi:hypothetical protein
MLWLLQTLLLQKCFFYYVFIIAFFLYIYIYFLLNFFKEKLFWLLPGLEKFLLVSTESTDCNHRLTLREAVWLYSGFGLVSIN